MCASKTDLELYIHIPFCIKKCNYCDFLSFPSNEERREIYVQSLINEIEQTGKLLDKDAYAVRSIFIGGGTPSLLSGKQIERIMLAVRNAFFIMEEAEITMETNPGTLTKENVFSYKKAGVNRFSMGLQSADDACLHLLGRIHTWEEFLKNYELARKAGFESIKIDLMSGLPGQTMSIYKKTLEKVMALRPEHISAYSLIVEEGTPFRERDLKLPDEDTEYRMYEDTAAILGEYGFHQYEISNYAKKGLECRHNKGYWQRTDYLGLGLGASSLIDHIRFSNTDNMEEYIKNSRQPEKIRCDMERLSEADEMAEFMFLGLRMTEGVSMDVFEKYFGKKMESIYGDVLKKHLSIGMLEKKESRIYLTRKGIHVSNGVMADFLL